MQFRRHLVAFILGSLLSTGSISGQTGFAEHDPRYRIQPSDVIEVNYRYTPEFDQTSTVQPTAMAGGLKSASAKHSQVVSFRRVGPDLAKTEILNLKSAMSARNTEP